MSTLSQSSLGPLLAGTALFESIDPEELVRLAERAALRSFRSGSVVFEEGQPAEAIYVIVSGSVAVRPGGPADEPVSILGPGDFFGEIALIIRANRTATVTAEAETVLVELPGPDILALAARSIPFRVRLGKIGTTRSRGSLASKLNSPFRRTGT